MDQHLFIGLLKDIFFFFFEDNCFPILCCFLPYMDMNQSQLYICSLPCERPSHRPPHPAPLGCHRASG